jgi:hypothetical protein
MGAGDPGGVRCREALGASRSGEARAGHQLALLSFFCSLSPLNAVEGAAWWRPEARRVYAMACSWELGWLASKSSSPLPTIWLPRALAW